MVAVEFVELPVALRSYAKKSKGKFPILPAEAAERFIHTKQVKQQGP
jgi:hypothetical protein